jgi:hypothetical protein
VSRIEVGITSAAFRADFGFGTLIGAPGDFGMDMIVVARRAAALEADQW